MNNNANKNGNDAANQTMQPFVLPNLPFGKKELNPHMSEETLNFHHGKHHQTYVTNLNNMIKDSDLTDSSLEDIIMASANKSDMAGIFNNAAQVWNHSFFWNSIKPNGGGKPTGKLLAAIEKDFGSYEAFVEEFKKAGATQFGSGWAWLVVSNGKLEIVKTPNAELPMTQSKTAIITCDVWEHAYYLDFQNKRPDYLTTFLDKLVNWDFALSNFEKATA